MKEKRIEEMAKEIASILTEAAHVACEDIPFAPLDLDSQCPVNIECHRCKEARMLIAKGYRKQSEGEDTNVPTKWISVEERLPEESCEVLTVDRTGVKYLVQYSGRYKAFNATDDDGDRWKFENVTHWMPLPDAPKGGDGK